MPIKPADSSPDKPSWSLWGTAKHFFGVRSKVQEGHASRTGAPLVAHNTTMPTIYGVNFKQVQAFYCKKAANKAKSFCAKPPTSTTPKPSMVDVKEVQRKLHASTRPPCTDARPLPPRWKGRWCMRVVCVCSVLHKAELTPLRSCSCALLVCSTRVLYSCALLVCSTHISSCAPGPGATGLQDVLRGP